MFRCTLLEKRVVRTYNFTPILTCAILLHKKYLPLWLSLMGNVSILNSFLDKKILLFKHALICRHCWFVLALSALPRTTPYVWGYYRFSRLRLSSHLNPIPLDLVVCLVAKHYPFAGVRPTTEVSPPLGSGMLFKLCGAHLLV